MKFVYNAAIDTLPKNANLAHWYRGQVSTQALKHVLNKCEEALHQHRFDKRHDSVLSLIRPSSSPTLRVLMYLQTYLDYPTPSHNTLLSLTSDPTSSFGMTIAAH